MIAYYHCDSIAIARFDAMAKIYQWVGVAQLGLTQVSLIITADFRVSQELYAIVLQSADED